MAIRNISVLDNFKIDDEKVHFMYTVQYVQFMSIRM